MKLYKYLLLNILIAGVIFGLVFAAMDYRENMTFDPGKFVYRVFVFGIGMGVINWWSNEYFSKKSEKNRWRN